MSLGYDNYVQEHIENVKQAFMWIQMHLPNIILDGDYNHILEHDKSKYDTAEYDAYDAYFYGGNKSYKVLMEFNYAWLHHIHNNPHHWQHWVLINEEGIIALEMPYEYVVEMICDWWSFSWKTGNLRSIFDWYDEHKDHIILGDETRKTVEDILNAIELRLYELNAMYDQEERDS